MPGSGAAQWYAHAGAAVGRRDGDAHEEVGGRRLDVVEHGQRLVGRRGRGRRACPARRSTTLVAERGDRPAVARVVELAGHVGRAVADGERLEERPAQVAGLQRAVDEEAAAARPARASNGTGHRSRRRRPWSTATALPVGAGGVNDSARSDDPTAMRGERAAQRWTSHRGQHEVGAHQRRGAQQVGAHRLGDTPTAGWRRPGTAAAAGAPSPTSAPHDGHRVVGEALAQQSGASRDAARRRRPGRRRRRSADVSAPWPAPRSTTRSPGRMAAARTTWRAASGESRWKPQRSAGSRRPGADRAADTAHHHHAHRHGAIVAAAAARSRRAVRFRAVRRRGGQTAVTPCSARRSARRRATRSLLARRAISRSRDALGLVVEAGQRLEAPVAQHDRDEDLVVVDRQVVDAGLGRSPRRGRRSRGCRRRASRTRRPGARSPAPPSIGSSSIAADVRSR